MDFTPTPLQKKLLAEGLCDERCAAFPAAAFNLPRQETGTVLLTVKDTRLLIYAFDGKETVGELLYSLYLNSVLSVSEKTGFWSKLFTGGLFEFSDEHETYTFRGTAKFAREIGVIRDNMRKKKIST